MSTFLAYNKNNTENFSNPISLSGKVIKHFGATYSGNPYWVTTISSSANENFTPYPYYNYLFYFIFHYQDSQQDEIVTLNNLGILDIFNISNLIEVQVHPQLNDFNSNLISGFEPDKLNIEIEYYD